MPDTTPPSSNCSRCGATLPVGSVECPRCLLELGLKAPDAEPSEPPPRASSAAGLPAGTAPTLEEVRAAFPDLEIVELLGRGGMGTVFKARQKKLQRTVAIKVLPRALGEDPAFAERFLREARALAKLSHPGIVTVHDFGQSGGFFFLVMEYVDGLDLRHLLRQGLLEPKQALTIACDLCQALQYAHDEGVVHRDIKPENVLLDARGRVKIADFGLAKLVHPDTDGFLSRADQVMGTPHYMAPEQLERPRDVDHRADIFSLGVVLYEMLTGSLPRGNFEPPSRRVHVDVRLDEIVLKALEREPERRYQQALEVKTDVDHVSSHPAAESMKAAREPRPPRPARKDWLRGPRVLGPIVSMWIVLAACWNAGAFPYGMAIPIAILTLGAVLQSRVHADPELAAAIDAQPRSHQAFRVFGSVALLAAGLVAISYGHFLHWERGTAAWRPSFKDIYRWFSDYKDAPVNLVAWTNASVVNPLVSLEREFTITSTDLAAFPPFLAIALGVLLISLGITVAVLSGTREVRRRAWHLGSEISGYSLAGLLVLWIGAPILALRSEPTFEGIEARVDSPRSFDDATTALRQILLRNGLQVDVEQFLRLDDQATGSHVGRARIFRAQADSPFERWSTSLRGPLRETPQVWTTVIEHADGQGSTIQVRAGIYAASSREASRAHEVVDLIQLSLAAL